MARKENKLSAEDMERVKKYLESPVPSVERKPFRPFLLLIVIVAVVIILGQLSYLIARYYGVF